MAVYFKLICRSRNCGELVVSDDKTKSYVHAYERAGVKATHQVANVQSVRLGVA